MEGEAEKRLSTVDYIVIITMLLISASIGIYFRLSGGRQKTTKVRITAIYVKSGDLSRNKFKYWLYNLFS